MILTMIGFLGILTNDIPSWAAPNQVTWNLANAKRMQMTNPTTLLVYMQRFQDVHWIGSFPWD
jgi:hypothetical protein